MTDASKPTPFPPGLAYIESAGWEQDKERGRRYIVRLCFPTGVPDLTAGDVWLRRPVKIEVLPRQPGQAVSWEYITSGTTDR